MNIFKSFFSILLFSISLFVSCSHLNNKSKDPKSGASSSEIKNGNDVKSESNQQDLAGQNSIDSEDKSKTDSKSNERNLETVSNKIQELIIAAKKTGGPTVTFLASDLFLKANAASNLGDWATARMLYKHLVNLVPNEDFVKRKYAESLIRVGLLNDAQVVLLELFKKSPVKNENLGLILAGVYTALLEKDEARSTYEEILKFNPKSEDACIFLARSYSQEGNSKAGITVLEKCERKNPNSGAIVFFKGKMALEVGDNEKALHYFQRALKLDPENSKAALAVGVLYEEKGKTQDALKIYKEFLEKNPEDLMILNKIVQAYLSLSKNHEVIPYLKTLTQLDPDNLNLKVKLGILFTEVENYESAKEIFNDILSQVPTSDKVLYYLGTIYQETNEFDKAIELFSRIPAESSLYYGSNIQIAHMLMIVASNNEENAEGADHIKKFLNFVGLRSESTPEIKVQLNVLKASFFENRMEISKAIETLEPLKNLKGFDRTHDYYLATLYDKASRYDEAYSVGMKILQDDPQNAHAWNFLGYSLLERGKDLNKAFEFIQKAISLKPEDGFIRDSLGWYYYRTGQFKMALKEMQKARKNVTDDVVISKHLAMVYQSLKQYNQAKKYFAEALKNTKIESERLSVLKAMEGLAQERFPASFSDESKKNIAEEKRSESDN